MSALLDALSWILLAGGAAFCMIGGLGLLRMPDFYTRTHAAGLTDTLGAFGVLTGLLLQSPDWIVAVKLLTILVFLWLTSPTSTHALVKAAFSGGGIAEESDPERGRAG